MSLIKTSYVDGRLALTEPDRAGRPRRAERRRLSIARRMVALHGGSIRVESTVGEGSTFTLTVPVRVERAGGG